jgi:2-dehydro-3-deoxygluconokinase
MPDLLAIGEVMAEIRNGSGDVNSPDFSVRFAGDTYNTAVYFKRELGAVGKVGFMTRVGQDNLSLTLIK